MRTRFSCFRRVNEGHNAGQRSRDWSRSLPRTSFLTRRRNRITARTKRSRRSYSEYSVNVYQYCTYGIYTVCAYLMPYPFGNGNPIDLTGWLWTRRGDSGRSPPAGGRGRNPTPMGGAGEPAPEIGGTGGRSAAARGRIGSPVFRMRYRGEGSRSSSDAASMVGGDSTLSRDGSWLAGSGASAGSTIRASRRLRGSVLPARS